MDDYRRIVFAQDAGNKWHTTFLSKKTKNAYLIQKWSNKSEELACANMFHQKLLNFAFKFNFGLQILQQIRALRRKNCIGAYAMKNELSANLYPQLLSPNQQLAHPN